MDKGIKIHISMADAERKAELIAHQRLVRDSAYNNDEDSVTQASRELEIETQVWRELEERYVII